MSEIEIKTELIEEICGSLPPTAWEEVSGAGKRGAWLGLCSGLGEVVAHAFQRGSFTEDVAKIARHVTYYSLFTASRFFQNLTILGEDDDPWEATFKSMQKSLLETSSLIGLNLGLEAGKRALQQVGENLAQAGFRKADSFLQNLSQLIPSFPYAASLCQEAFYTGSVKCAISTLAAGRLSHGLVEYAGCVVADNLISEAPQPSTRPIRFSSVAGGCISGGGKEEAVLSEDATLSAFCKNKVSGF